MLLKHAHTHTLTKLLDFSWNYSFPDVAQTSYGGGVLHVSGCESQRGPKNLWRIVAALLPGHNMQKGVSNTNTS